MITNLRLGLGCPGLEEPEDWNNLTRYMIVRENSWQSRVIWAQRIVRLQEKDI